MKKELSTDNVRHYCMGHGILVFFPKIKRPGVPIKGVHGSVQQVFPPLFRSSLHAGLIVFCYSVDEV